MDAADWKDETVEGNLKNEAVAMVRKETAVMERTRPKNTHLHSALC